MSNMLNMLVIIVLLMTIFILTAKYIVWGFKILLGKIRYKEETAFLLLRGKNNNFGLPHVINQAQEAIVIKISGKKLTFPIIRKDKPEVTLLGMPLYIRDIEDASHDIGLVYSTPAPTEDDQNKVSVSFVKSPYYIGSEEHQIVIDNAKLNNTVKTLLDNYQIVFYIVVGLIIVSLFNAYASWEIISFINNM